MTLDKSPCRISVAKAEKTTQAEKKNWNHFSLAGKLFLLHKNNLSIQKTMQAEKKLKF